MPVRLEALLGLLEDDTWASAILLLMSNGVEGKAPGGMTPVPTGAMTAGGVARTGERSTNESCSHTRGCSTCGCSLAGAGGQQANMMTVGVLMEENHGHMGIMRDTGCTDKVIEG
ncbi:hypothetical protein Vafri_17262 [Volvox africanus]|uniref:Uncharacterized protein n=1 Tax=Volvox africanus TaxID=51714 RepID=A0A8J4FAJ3_9CHLO|nr:hypothetical protein Vafri_17262 [Volvox africanus]